MSYTLHSPFNNPGKSLGSEVKHLNIIVIYFIKSWSRKLFEVIYTTDDNDMQ